MLKGKKILLGITGSIAAYKSILLVRLLVQAGAEVKVVMTPAATDFVSKLTLATLSKNKVLVELADEATWSNHVMLGRWADVMLVAPASCNTLAKMAAGICDNLLQATYLSATCPVVVSPAMDEDMWHHASTQRNLSMLREAGNAVIPVGKGELASGLYGEGRMAEPEHIIEYLEENFFRGSNLKDTLCLVTAGPTYEAIDPVRFIGNHSSGKMGIAVANELYMNGAQVHLVLGPVESSNIRSGIKVTKVNTAEEMYNACASAFPATKLAVMAAAVADYTCKEVAPCKIKKSEGHLNLELEKSKDILASLGAVKKEDQFLVGFALETNNEEENALKKLASKNADLIVLNSMRDEAAGFKKDTNKVTIFDREQKRISYEAKEKHLVAKDIVELIIQKLHAKA
ncbi:bifunctional phosphopantothenoylcysteine decarboxylase/phosphopantothenate--cysteine ligase CoaBC [Aridibaculum aurantiacum]|uniref:bifunctional phosphopantothenoylcysteine decarboxylase/phosphopantothenate--cysteine ligase CoaBC n=1 Tax=Aridibaculum aurantiacum TaxID=2810307 RepID=UPI001A95745E|nr:bifunctional phosphopantothenoylcysteine decarboxylase/phosphopantothenate--cysteine ligase CoaBC [Aridibaculum aurantiacum]